MDPSYANIFKDALKWDMVSRYHLEPHTIDTSMISFFIWTHGENTLHNFHSTIKFTIEYSTTSNPFLDVLVCLNNYISTTLYTKPTNGHCYLNFNSCHSTSLEKKKEEINNLQSVFMYKMYLFWKWGLQNTQRTTIQLLSQ